MPVSFSVIKYLNDQKTKAKPQKPKQDTNLEQQISEQRKKLAKAHLSSSDNKNEIISRMESQTAKLIRAEVLEELHQPRLINEIKNNRSQFLNRNNTFNFSRVDTPIKLNTNIFSENEDNRNFTIQTINGDLNIKESKAALILRTEDGSAAPTLNLAIDLKGKLGGEDFSDTVEIKISSLTNNPYNNKQTRGGYFEIMKLIKYDQSSD